MKPASAPPASRPADGTVLRPVIKGLAIAAVLLGSPLLGAALAGYPLSLFLKFPPLTQFVPHAPFSWPVFVLLSVLALVTAGAMIALYYPPAKVITQERKGRRFPVWGWPALLSTGVFWVLAWTRFEWVQPWRALIFPLLWTSYIAATNALTYWRSGSCSLTHSPRMLLTLFPMSAVFWWYFEYLNRFVQNWHYLGQERYSPAEYIVYATLAFSTVLPAVSSTTELLRTIPGLQHPHYDLRLNISNRRGISWSLLGLGSLCLAGSAIWPDYLFWVIWVSPAFLLMALLHLFGQEPPLFSSRQGEGQLIALSTLAALLCGFLWEMWNYYSEPKWIYSVPFVDRFHVFEMPLLGYLGYLPFGIECLLVADLAKRLCSRPAC